MLTHGIKNLTMSLPQNSSINGAVLDVNIPLSHSFQVSHQFNFANRKQNG
jgi:hypothetical protein